jgi:hypothetical protein
MDDLTINRDEAAMSHIAQECREASALGQATRRLGIAQDRIEDLTPGA